MSAGASARRDFAYSRMRPCRAYQPGSPGRGCRNSPRRARPSSVRVAPSTPARLEQRTAEPLEVRGTGERIADRPRRGRHDLLREVGEQRALRVLQAVEDSLPTACRGGPKGLDRQAHGCRPPARRRQDPSRGIGRGITWHDVGRQERRHERLDLVRGEGECRATDVGDLALCPEPFDAERRIVARGQQDVQLLGREADQRLDEAPRPRRSDRSRGSRPRRAAGPRRARPGAHQQPGSPLLGRDAWPPPRPSGRWRSRSASPGPPGAPGPAGGAQRRCPPRTCPDAASMASTVYQAAGRLRATRDARVLLPNPAPATTIVRRRSAPATSRASRSGRSRVPLGSRGGTSFAARLVPGRRGRTMASCSCPGSVIPSAMGPSW